MEYIAEIRQRVEWPSLQIFSNRAGVDTSVKYLYHQLRPFSYNELVENRNRSKQRGGGIFPT